MRPDLPMMWLLSPSSPERDDLVPSSQLAGRDRHPRLITRGGRVATVSALSPSPPSLD
jgi:hypothetical protein